MAPLKPGGGAGGRGAQRGAVVAACTKHTRTDRHRQRATRRRGAGGGLCTPRTAAGPPEATEGRVPAATDHPTDARTWSCRTAVPLRARDRTRPEGTRLHVPGRPLLRPAAPSRNLPRPSPRGPLQSPAPGRLRPVRNHQVRDAGAVVGELLVAGHAVDADDVDDGVLRADPHLALLHQHHAGLRAPRGPKPVGSRPRRPCPLPTPANSGPPLPGDHSQAPASLWSRFANRSTHGLASVCLDTVSHKSRRSTNAELGTDGTRTLGQTERPDVCLLGGPARVTRCA